jgi:hypothetical protein
MVSIGMMIMIITRGTYWNHGIIIPVGIEYDIIIPKRSHISG